MAEIWEQQPGETTKAWEAFQAYRDLRADRSIDGVMRVLGKVWGLNGAWKRGQANIIGWNAYANIIST